MTDDEILEGMNANAKATAAAGVFFTAVILLISQHPGVDKELLKRQLADLHLPEQDDRVFVQAFDGLRDNLIQGLG